MKLLETIRDNPKNPEIPNLKNEATKAHAEANKFITDKLKELQKKLLCWTPQKINTY